MHNGIVGARSRHAVVLYGLFMLLWGMLASVASAATITLTAANTNWSSITGGSGPNGLPSNSDTIIVKNGRTLTVNVSNAVASSIQLGSNTAPNAGTGTLAFNAGSALEVSGAVTLGSGTRSGTVRMTNGGTLTLRQFSYVNGTFTPGSGTVVMTATNTLPNNGTFSTFNNLTINGAGTTTSLGRDTTISGTLTLTSGTLAVGANRLTLNGPAIAGTPANMSTTSSSSLTFGGSSTGVSLPSSVTQLSGLTINNSNGITLNSSPTVNGTLTLTNGKITTGNFKLTTNCSSISGASSQRYVLGNLQLIFPSGSATCTFHVGSSTAYAPINLTATSAGGTLTGSTTGNEHPQIADSDIDSTKDANRYWTLGAAGDTISVTTYNAVFNFVVADLDSSATPTSFIVGKYSSNTWTMPASVTTGSTSVTISNVAGPISIPTDFAIGQVAEAPCTVPSDLAGVKDITCVCDNFGRASLNPSTINGGNWILSTSSGSFGVPKIVNSGFLRMTDNSLNVATAATLPGTFPAKGNLVTVEFKHYAFCGSTSNTCGADGIALTLSDASVAPVPGAYGGSLGYAQKSNINGFAGGWVGVGIDEYGNYQTNTEGRGSGTGSSLVRDSIAVRGSGTGSSNSASNYSYLAGTGILSPGVDDATATTSALGHAYRISVDARCYQLDTNTGGLSCNNPSLAKKAQVTVHRDTTGNGNFSSSNKLLDFDAYTANASQASVPTNWKLSFTGSTGSWVNIHEIKGLRVCAASITRPPSIAVDDYSPSTCASAANGKTTVTITGVKSDGSTDTAYTKTVSITATLSGGGASNAVWTRKGANGTLTTSGSTATYTFVAADQGVATFYLADATQQDVYLTVTETTGGLSSSLPVPVKFGGNTFAITATDTLSTGVVAGRNHLMRITRTNGCNTNTSYTGTKNLDGWYTPDAYHPIGANAPMICAANASGTCLPTTGTCQTLSIAAPTVSSSVNNLPALAFTNGVASFCLATSDVGKFTLSVRDDVTSTSSPVIGTTTTLTARPFAVVVSGVTNGTVNNPGSTTGGGSYFTTAGSNFSATVGGYLWATQGDNNGDGLPDSSTSLANLIGGGLAPNYADTVVLSTAAPVWPTGGTIGTLSNGSVTVDSGTGTAASLNYSEVGSFTLSALPSTNYLGSGINLSNRVAIYATPGDTSAPSAVVGRFIPAQFALSAGTVTPACSAGATPFTYVGQPLTAAFTLAAQNAQGVTTTNYTGTDFARLSLSSFSAFSFGAVNGATSLTSRLDDSLVTPLGSWNAGIAEVTVPVKLTRGPTPDSPFNDVKLGIRPVDPDGVTLPVSALNLNTDGVAGNDKAQIDASGTVMRFGRLRLFNAHGSERLNLPIPSQAEFWNGNTFVLNTDDMCTSFGASNVFLRNHSGGITATNMGTANIDVDSVPFNMGKGSLVLKKPSPTPTAKGKVEVCVRLDSSVTSTSCAATVSAGLPWLQGRWYGSSTSYIDDPVVRATFGVYGGGPVIYIREVY